jgi:hypothetical protein
LLFLQLLHPSLNHSVARLQASQHAAEAVVDDPWLMGLQAAITAESKLPARSPHLSLLATFTLDNSSIYLPDIAGVLLVDQPHEPCMQCRRTSAVQCKLLMNG